jgi:hypothetical protein
MVVAGRRAREDLRTGDSVLISSSLWFVWFLLLAEAIYLSAFAGGYCAVDGFVYFGSFLEAFERFFLHPSLREKAVG